MSTLPRFDRRQFIAYFSAVGLSNTLLPGTLYAQVQQDGELTTETIAKAEQLAGLSFTEEQRELLVEDLTDQLEDFKALREVSIPNSVVPAMVFDPRISGVRPGQDTGPIIWEPPKVDLPGDEEALAFMSVAELSSLLKSRKVTSVDLTKLYLKRLKEYDSRLEAVVTYTDDLALQQAAKADIELDAGIWRGPLHGVPYGAKDLLSVKGYPTTWGAMPYKEQVIDEDATVVRKLEGAGAVLLAKLTLGALAWGDVWFGGKTKNPWNLEQGSSGSSAGPGAAVAAGLVGFAIGSETLGSIVSPSTRNGVTGHRPTFGTVSRYGAMTLSWTMDKLGPMARSAEDCALIFDAIRGVDNRDPSTVSSSFAFRSNYDVTKLRVGYLREAFESEYSEGMPNQKADDDTLNVLRDLGIELQPISLPNELPIGAILMTLGVEAAAAFDKLTLSGGVDEMVRQGKNTWPHEFRKSRFIPAVEFLQANRLRALLMLQMTEALSEVDVFLSPSFKGGTLRITNLTGHPCVCVPNAFHPLEDHPESPRRQPGSITFVGGLYKDAEVLGLAHAYQQATRFHRQRPPIQ